MPQTRCISLTSMRDPMSALTWLRERLLECLGVGADTNLSRVHLHHAFLHAITFRKTLLLGLKVTSAAL